MAAVLAVGALGFLPTAARAGAAATAGVDNWGAIGNGTGVTRKLGGTPQAVPGLGPVVALAASNSDGYALTSGGTELAWGYGGWGELGDDTPGKESFDAPVKVDFPTGTVIKGIGEAEDDGYAVDAAGDAWSWGRNAAGELCDGTTSMQYQPTEIPLPSPATAVAGGSLHVMWLTADGKVYTCGVGSHGELGNGTFGTSTTPVEVVGLPSSPVVAISSGVVTDAALTASGELWMWGSGREGDLGDGSTTDTDVPVRVPGTWSSVYVGGSTYTNTHTVGITTSGAVEAWGANKSGQLGDGTESASSEPVAVEVPPGVTFKAVMAGGDESGAIDTNGNVWMWGLRGLLGDGSQRGYETTPTEVASGRSMLTGTSANVIDG